jgi:hypothetical protein
MSKESPDVTVAAGPLSQPLTFEALPAPAWNGPELDMVPRG